MSLALADFHPWAICLNFSSGPVATSSVGRLKCGNGTYRHLESQDSDSVGLASHLQPLQSVLTYTIFSFCFFSLYVPIDLTKSVIWAFLFHGLWDSPIVNMRPSQHQANFPLSASQGLNKLCFSYWLKKLLFILFSMKKGVGKAWAVPWLQREGYCSTCGLWICPAHLVWMWSDLSFGLKTYACPVCFL